MSSNLIGLLLALVLVVIVSMLTRKTRCPECGEKKYLMVWKGKHTIIKCLNPECGYRGQA